MTQLSPYNDVNKLGRVELWPGWEFTWKKIKRKNYGKAIINIIIKRKIVNDGRKY